MVDRVGRALVIAPVERQERRQSVRMTNQREKRSAREIPSFLIFEFNVVRFIPN